MPCSKALTPDNKAAGAPEESAAGAHKKARGSLCAGIPGGCASPGGLFGDVAVRQDVAEGEELIDDPVDAFLDRLRAGVEGDLGVQRGSYGSSIPVKPIGLPSARAVRALA